MSDIRDLKNDPVEQRARRLAEHVYVALGCASVPALQRVIAEALRKEALHNKPRFGRGLCADREVFVQTDQKETAAPVSRCDRSLG